MRTVSWIDFGSRRNCGLLPIFHSTHLNSIHVGICMQYLNEEICIILGDESLVYINCVIFKKTDKKMNINLKLVSSKVWSIGIQKHTK